MHGGKIKNMQEPKNRRSGVCPVSLEDLLNEIKLSHFMDSFIREGVDMDLLLSLNDGDMKECLKEVGMSRFGERHRLITVIRREKESRSHQIVSQSVSSTEELLLDDTHESSSSSKSSPLDENLKAASESLSEEQEPPQISPSCQLCKEATQHKCRLCEKPVCNLFCSIQDPNSDNESHRVHKKGDARCSVIPCSQSSPVVLTSDESSGSISSVFITESNSERSNKSEEPNEDIRSDTSIDYDCTLCKDPKPEDPLCNRCKEKLCFLCSVKDPNSDDFDRRIHRPDDVRCYSSNRFECPCCNLHFKTSEEIESHMTNDHPVTDLSDVVQQIQSDITNLEKDNLSPVRLESKGDSPSNASGVYNPIVVSESDEELPDISLPIQSPKNKRRRIKQNLLHVSFLDDTLDDPDWQIESSDHSTLNSPTNPFLQFIDEEADKLMNSKRKRDNKPPISDFSCEICGAKLSRKDSLQRHKRLKH